MSKKTALAFLERIENNPKLCRKLRRRSKRERMVLLQHKAAEWGMHFTNRDYVEAFQEKYGYMMN